MLHFEMFSTEELLAFAALDLENDNLFQGMEKLKHLKNNQVESDELDSMLGSVYAKLQLFHQAVEHYSALLERTPSRLHERFQLGMVYREMNELGKAAECWDGVLDVEENYPPVLFHKALLLILTGEEVQAISLLQQLVATAESDNYYVERALGVLEEISAASQEPTPVTQKLDQVH